MKYVESASNDPYFNLALEQYIFDSLAEDDSFFMLWQNENTIVIGKNQNTVEEINPSFVKEHNIHVARRLSGGGAVYHDLGNLNFTFVENKKDMSALDFSIFCNPIIHALSTLGVQAELSGRNDMTIEGKKFSGNSQYIKHNRVMHHGTILFDSDLDIIPLALCVSQDKIESKGLKSVRSRTTNIKPYIADASITLADFKKVLLECIFAESDISPYALTPKDLDCIHQLKQDVYAQWEWNYGYSPKYSTQKQRRIDGCGKIDVQMNVENGMIEDIFFSGDYFSMEDTPSLAALLKKQPLNENSLSERLTNVEIERYFKNLTSKEFLSILLE